MPTDLSAPPPVPENTLFDPVPSAEVLADLPLTRNAAVLKETISFDGAAVLDVGSGDGKLCRLMAECGARVVVGLEVEDRQLAHALAAPAMPGVVYLKASGEELPIPSASLDVVVYFNSLHHLPSPAAMASGLAEAERVLVPGGRLYVAEPIAAGAFFALTRLVDDETEVRAQAYNALCHLGPADSPLKLEQERLYINTIKEPSFAAFKSRMTSIDPVRDALFAEAETELQQLYDGQGQADPNDPAARLFTQPMRMMVFRKSL